jgi:hypothetical protein
MLHKTELSFVVLTLRFPEKRYVFNILKHLRSVSLHQASFTWLRKMKEKLKRKAI